MRFQINSCRPDNAISPAILVGKMLLMLQGRKMACHWLYGMGRVSPSLRWNVSDLHRLKRRNVIECKYAILMFINNNISTYRVMSESGCVSYDTRISRSIIIPGTWNDLLKININFLDVMFILDNNAEKILVCQHPVTSDPYIVLISKRSNGVSYDIFHEI